MSRLLLGAPLTGWAMPLDQVPDPVFAERMMGEGVAIDPLEGLVVAPAAARISAAPVSAHAVTLELAGGAHLLIHVGIDTVALDGEGFELCVTEGQQVSAGEPLIRFDLDRVARRAKSLISPVVLIDSGFTAGLHAVDRRVRAGEPLFSVEGSSASLDPAGVAVGPWIERRVTVLLPNGVHARPAARIVGLLKSHDAELQIEADQRSGDARSMVALLALGLKVGDEVRLSARGADAEAAIAAVAALLHDVTHEAPARVAKPVVPLPNQPERAIFHAIPAAPGLAIGPLAQARIIAIDVAFDGCGLEQEASALEAAIAAVGASLANGCDIAQAHLAILQDPALRLRARAEIGNGRSAGQAWRTATASASASIGATGDALLIERIADLDDVERQVLSQLAGSPALAVPEIEAGSILVADDLLPSQFLALRARLAGVVTARGGATSHVAILAGAAGIPMLVGAGPMVLALPEGRQVVLDAEAGTLIADGEPTTLATAGQRLAARNAHRAADRARAREQCRMRDGTRIEIFANLAERSEAEAAVTTGAEGCGLLRTEFLFLGRSEPPSEEEQEETYRGIAAALQGRPMIVRTLDIGADKQVEYLSLPCEDNPALGQRGIRLSLAHPELLRSQLRAILRGVPADQCRIMLPMVNGRDEVRAVRAMLDAESAALALQERVPLGVMIETPAAALLSSVLAEEADFFSVGTNDLTQYTLACDRLNPATAALADPLDPSVLRLVRIAAEGAHGRGRWIGLCGGLASDPAAAAILIGLGITELSVATAVIPQIKGKVRGLDLKSCIALAERALLCTSAREVRELLAVDSDGLRGAA